MKYIQILDSLVPQYSEKLLNGEYNNQEMPLLAAIEKRFSQGNKMENIYIIACQHLLIPQLEMFKLFIRMGIPPSQIAILPKIYSANEKIMSELKKLGCILFETAMDFNPSKSFDQFHREQCMIAVSHAQKFPNNGKIIVLDDGGMLLKAFAETKDFKTLFAGRIYGVEQTASGKNILLRKKLPFLVTSVASSIEKLMIETNYIIRHSLLRIKQYFDEQQVPKTAKILVLGKGPIGKTMIEQISKEGYDCHGYDLSDGTFKHQLNTYEVIIGATGSNSISLDQLKTLKTGVHLISISSSDREFPSVHIRNRSKSGNNVHDTFVYTEREIKLANGGFPVTFKGEEVECYPVEMDVTMMKLAEAVLSHATGKSAPEGSINELYGELKIFPILRKILYGYAILMAGLCLIKTTMVGFSAVSPTWIQVSLFIILLLGMIPWFWLLSNQFVMNKQAQGK